MKLGAAFLAKIESNQEVVREYCQQIEYVNGEIEAVYHEVGRVVFDNGGEELQFHITDHLGNVRILFQDDGSGVGELLQENHFRPFGMEMRGSWNNQTSPLQRYLYNGKELDTDFGLNWYFYGFRMYDNAICRFSGVDPIASQFP